MNAQLDRVSREICRRSVLPARLNSRPKCCSGTSHEDTVQLIYALPSTSRCAWPRNNIFGHKHKSSKGRSNSGSLEGRPGGALNDWVRAEREVTKNLCDALLHRNIREPELVPVSH